MKIRITVLSERFYNGKKHTFPCRALLKYTFFFVIARLMQKSGWLIKDGVEITNLTIPIAVIAFSLFLPHLITPWMFYATSHNSFSKVVVLFFSLSLKMCETNLLCVHWYFLWKQINLVKIIEIKNYRLSFRNLGIPSKLKYLKKKN